MAEANNNNSSSEASSLSVDEKVEIITRNLQETLGTAELKKIVAERSLKIYWGTAPTGKPHIAYFVPMSKIADFLRAGCEVKILLADLHAYLDNMKSTWELLEYRQEYYKHAITAILQSLKVPIEKLTFVKGTGYQLSREYTLDVYKISSICTQHDAKKGGAEVVKQVDSPLLSGLLYPCLQALDEQYLDVDAQFGGVDQRKIFVLAEKLLPRLGYKKRIHFMNPMVPGLTGDKMSSSVVDSKIDLLDGKGQLKKKIGKAFCEPGNIENNGLLSFVKMVLLPTSTDGKFHVKRCEANGGDITFDTYEALEQCFAKKELHPQDLKGAVIEYVNALLEPIRNKFNSKEMKILLNKAYPPPPKQKKNANSNANKAVDYSRLDIRVGKIVEAEKHPKADALYVQKIDVGDDAPRVIVSGFANYFKLEDLPGKHVVVLCNLKPTNLRSIKSFGMVLGTKSEDKSKLELLVPPEGSKAGDKVTVDGFSSDSPDAQLPPKQKIWEAVQADMKISSNCQAVYKDSPLKVNENTVVVDSLTGNGIA